MNAITFVIQINLREDAYFSQESIDHWYRYFESQLTGNEGYTAAIKHIDGDKLLRAIKAMELLDA